MLCFGQEKSAINHYLNKKSAWYSNFRSLMYVHIKSSSASIVVGIASLLFESQSNNQDCGI
jgi:hypothetical protein